MLFRLTATKKFLQPNVFLWTPFLVGWQKNERVTVVMMVRPKIRQEISTRGKLFHPDLSPKFVANCFSTFSTKK